MTHLFRVVLSSPTIIPLPTTETNGKFWMFNSSSLFTIIRTTVLIGGTRFEAKQALTTTIETKTRTVSSLRIRSWNSRVSFDPEHAQIYLDVDVCVRARDCVSATEVPCFGHCSVFRFFVFFPPFADGCRTSYKEYTRSKRCPHCVSREKNRNSDVADDFWLSLYSQYDSHVTHISACGWAEKTRHFLTECFPLVLEPRTYVTR